MDNRLRIGVDGDGGENNGDEIVTGALRFAKNHPDTDLVLYVTPEKVQAIRERRDFPDNVAPVETHGHVDDYFRGGIKTLQSDNYKDSSMVQMLNSLKEGSIDAGFTAGATGPFILGASVIVGKTAKDIRLTLASEFPSSQNPTALGVDMGANPRVTPEHVLSYSLLASEYLKLRYGIDAPTGSLGIGTEDGKGESFHIEVNKLMRIAEKQGLLNYMGNVEPESFFNEPRKIIAGKAFDMNIALKMAKPTSDFTLKSLAIRLLGPKIGPDFARFLKRKTSKNGGALLLGANKPLGKGNGSSDSGMAERAIGEVYTFDHADREKDLIREMSKGYVDRYQQFKTITTPIQEGN